MTLSAEPKQKYRPFAKGWGSNMKPTTWLEPEEHAYPNGGMTRRGRALWPDGKLRAVRAGIPDTFFSIPAWGRLRGKYVVGFLVVNEDGEYRFCPNKKAADA